jgi:hypothetical protein
MNDDSSGVPDAGTSEEPALTQRNTATVRGEEDLSTDSTAGAAPTYGPAGNTTDAEEEGADGHGI